MKPFLADPDFSLYVGDAVDVLRALPDESVHCVVTSPPYWGLRDYGTGSWEGGDLDCDHAPVEGRGVQTDPKKNLSQVPGSPNRGGDPWTCRCGARRIDQQIGLEATPAEYVARIVGVFREVRRVLRHDGTCWINLGDSYVSNPSGGMRGLRSARAASRRRTAGVRIRATVRPPPAWVRPSVRRRSWA